MVARFVGAGQRRMARRVTGQALLLGVVVVVIVMTVGLTATDELIAVVQLEGRPAQLAVRFLRIVLVAAPLLMVEEVAIACLRGAGDTVAGLVTMSIVNVVNVTVAWTLIAGGLGQTLGITGWDSLAIGTAVANAVGGSMMLSLLLAGRAGLRLRLARLTPDVDLARRLLRIGLPGGGDQLAIVSCHLWYVSIINQLGKAATAAHGIGVRIESLAYLPGFAFQIAAATLVGQFLGARDARRAGRAVLVTLLTGGGVMLGAGLLLVLFPQPLVRIFVAKDKIDLIELTASLLPIVGAAMPALAVVSIVGGALRGAGDTRWPLAITLFGLILVRIPLTQYLAHDQIYVPLLDQPLAGANLGVVGAWYAMVIDATVRCLLILYRFFHGGWKRVEV
jgi:putative MATE family efflux protein